MTKYQTWHHFTFSMAETLPLERVERAIRSLKSDVKNIQGATEFLLTVELGKCNVSRYLSWIMILNGLPEDPDQWAKTLYYVIRGYRSKMNYYAKDGEIPTCLGAETTNAIKSDVSRSKTMFKNFTKYIGIPEELCDDAETRIIRLSVLVFREAPQYPYLQGYDRFASISYALALNFVSRIGLSYIEAEALAASLLRRLITLSDAEQYLASGSKMMHYFCDVDAFLRVHNPGHMAIVSARGNGSVAFASNWSGVLFTESHDPAELLLIWDQFVVRHMKSALYFKAMTSAHLTQIPIAESEFAQLEAIQRYNRWDIHKLIRDAAELYEGSVYGQPRTEKHGLIGFTSWL